MQQRDPGKEFIQAETEQALLRETIARSGEMIAQADRLIAASRLEQVGPEDRPVVGAK